MSLFYDVPLDNHDRTVPAHCDIIIEVGPAPAHMTSSHCLSLSSHCLSLISLCLYVSRPPLSLS